MPNISWAIVELGIIPAPSLGAAGDPVCPSPVPSSPFSLGTAATQPGLGTGASVLLGFRLRAGRCPRFVPGDKPCCIWGGGAGCGAGRDVRREAQAGSGRDRRVGFAWRGRVLGGQGLKRESGSTAQPHHSGDTELVGLNHGLGPSSPRGARPQHRFPGPAASLNQPSSVSANVGETVRITCSGASSSSDYGWFQQKVPGSGPVTVIYNNNNRPSGIPSRFSGSGGTLTITGVQAEDEAVYFCGGEDSSAGVFGAGTTLTVLGQPKAAPTVHLFAPSSEEMTSLGKATLVCLMEDFYPRSVTVEWVADGSTITSGVETSQPQRQSNNQYMASSYLSLDASKWQSYNSVSCKVRHEAGNVEKTVKRSEC
ncbi:immunoglobulin lambda-1 light chain-like isoform X2 [Corvus cornix cornix]|uniref:immunoglobulin lambda-1 light chain-like isoform X2 n=1 Tax=Corvus cornix cornix TaxID=932674 RepID=UPI00195012CF|nr:immunoglobulin lambda-1 light chain-like isoform X2 [Corvus cornix cornix]